jgi:hypothetical protein
MNSNVRVGSSPTSGTLLNNITMLKTIEPRIVLVKQEDNSVKEYHTLESIKVKDTYVFHKLIVEEHEEYVQVDNHYYEFEFLNPTQQSCIFHNDRMYIWKTHGHEIVKVKKFCYILNLN